MDVLATNKYLYLSLNDDEKAILKEFTYIDKNLLHKAKNLARSYWASADQVKRAKEAAYKKVYKEVDGKFLIPSGLLYLVKEFQKNYSGSFIDQRVDTGVKFSFPWVNTPPKMRNYQEEALECLLKDRRGIVNLATGLGKSLIIINLVRRVGRRSLIIAPSQAIAVQLEEDFKRFFGSANIGFYGAGRKKLGKITIAIAHTVSKKAEELKKADFGLIVWDEAHRVPANTFYAAQEKLGDVGLMYGFTATDFRADGRDILLNCACGNSVYSKDARWGIENGWLAKPKFLVRGVQTFGSDYKDDKLKCYQQHVLHSSEMKQRILDDCKVTLSKGKRLLVIVDSIEHGEELSAQLGLPFARGEDRESNLYIRQLNSGEIPGLIGTEGKISEGCDTRSVEVLVMAAFPGSDGAILQTIGRGLRKTENKSSVVILDYAPLGSSMLLRHAKRRIAIYKNICDDVIVINVP
jgi:superfamily II DNA or RNA helicase